MNIKFRNREFVVCNKFGSWWKNKLVHGNWESKTFDAIDMFIKKDKDMIDIGAWIFPITLYSADKCNKLFAFEPIEETYNVGKENLKLNKITNVFTFKKALWSETTKLLMQEKIEKDSSTYCISNKGNAIDTISFNDFKENSDISNVNLVKMDIEGGEGILLPVMSKWLHENKVTLILSIHPQFKIDKNSYNKIIFEVVSKYPYVYKIDEQEYLCTYDNAPVKDKFKLLSK